MGSELDADNKPHEVTLSRPFLLQKTPVTQAQWKAVMGTEPSQFKGDDLRPVEQISWTDIQEFLRALEKATGRAHRLPTDAEWEYACRAGSTGDLAGDLSALAWYKANSGGSTQPVATKAPNAWGLYDMHGNVCEWVQDYYSQLYDTRLKDPTGASFGSTRVVRGGSWFNSALVARSTPRGSLDETTRDNVNGFRIVRIG
jgi:formylglycine-generating enzyme required for sulfatase activity